MDAPQDRGAAVAQSGTVAGGEHRGEIAGIAVQHRVADGIDAEVNAVEAPCANPPRDRVSVKAEFAKLAPLTTPYCAEASRARRWSRSGADESRIWGLSSPQRKSRPLDLPQCKKFAGTLTNA